MTPGPVGKERDERGRPSSAFVADGVLRRVAGKSVTTAELFFDLVFVFAITQVSALLEQDLSWMGLVRALVVFVVVYWAWVGTTIYANTHDLARARRRLGLCAIAFCSLIMALAVPASYRHTGLLIATPYLILRVLLAIMVCRGRGIGVAPFIVAVLASGPLLVTGAVLHGRLQLSLWALAAAVDLATPLLTRRFLVTAHFDTGHLPERFGLLVLIALGESITSIGGPATTEHPRIDVLAAVTVAFLLTLSLWWLYFGREHGGIRSALQATPKQTDVVRPVLAYGHLVFVAAIIAVAGGLRVVVAEPLHRTDSHAIALLYGGCALYLAAFSTTQHRISGNWWTARWATAALLLAILPAAIQLPAVAALAVLAGLITALAVLDRGARTNGGHPLEK